jgi:CelD/BcsL family acetyltransferase involved in cellulose biosynthesis
MDYNILASSLDELKDYRADSSQTLNWFSPFILTEWLQVWWQVFSSGAELFIRVVKQGEKIIGIAPLMIKDGVAYFIGSTDVCDYLDFIIVPGREQDFFNVLLDDLKKTGITQLDLKHVRPDSTVLTSLAPLAESRKYKVVSDKEAISFEMDLPSTFEKYLEMLSTKQRHEVRRKMRRLTEEGKIVYQLIDRGEELKAAVDTFFKMFVESRQDKAAFLTEQMKSYFKLLVDTMAGIGLLKLGVLELDSKPVAEIMCFDYQDCIYLYNSGYDPKYVSLSAGLLSKVYAIRDSIEKGSKKFDFLKGAEPYKGHLGGKEVPLYRCQINIV